MTTPARRLRAGIEQLAAEGRYDRLMQICKTTLRAARKQGDLAAETTALIGLSVTHEALGKVHEAGVLARGALDYARDLNEREFLVDALLCNTEHHLRGRGEPYSALADAREALDLAAEIDYQYGVAYGLYLSAAALQLRGQMEAARSAAREALDLTDALNADTLQIRCLVLLGNLDAARGEERSAAQALQHALDLCAIADQPMLEVETQLSLGRLLIADEQKRDEARRMIQSALKQAHQCSALLFEFETAEALGRLALEEGDFETASKHFDALATMAARHQHPLLEMHAQRALGDLALESGQPLVAAEAYDLLIQMARQQQNPALQAEGQMLAAAAFMQVHEYDKAIAALHAARQVFAALDEDAQSQRLLFEIVLAYLLRGVDLLLRLLGLRRRPASD